MDDWSADARSVLDDARGADEPSRADRARIDAKLAARLGAAALVTGGVVGSSAGASAASLGAAGTVGLGVKAVVFAAVLAAATGGGVVAFRAAHHASNATAPRPSLAHASAHAAPPPVPIIAQPAPVIAEPATVIAPPPVVAPAATTHHRAVATTSRETPAPTATTQAAVRIDAIDAVRDEQARLATARGQLAHGDAAGAIATVDDLAARYPSGQRVEDRAALRVMALCAAGRSAEARDAAAAFERAWPGSVFIARMGAAARCGE